MNQKEIEEKADSVVKAVLSICNGSLLNAESILIEAVNQIEKETMK